MERLSDEALDRLFLDHKRDLLPFDHFDLESIPRRHDPSPRDREIPAPGESTDDEGADENEE